MGPCARRFTRSLVAGLGLSLLIASACVTPTRGTPASTPQECLDDCTFTGALCLGGIYLCVTAVPYCSGCFCGCFDGAFGNPKRSPSDPGGMASASKEVPPTLPPLARVTEVAH